MEQGCARDSCGCLGAGGSFTELEKVGGSVRGRNESVAGFGFGHLGWLHIDGCINILPSVGQSNCAEAGRAYIQLCSTSAWECARCSESRGSRRTEW